MILSYVWHYSRFFFSQLIFGVCVFGGGGAGAGAGGWLPGSMKDQIHQKME